MSGRAPAPEPLVGRSAELRHLSAGLSRCVDGDGQLVVLSGDAGTGKTALAEVIAEEAAAVDGVVLWGRAHEGPEAPPYLPWTRILRAGMAAAPPGWPPEPEPLGALVPELAGRARAGTAPAAVDTPLTGAARFRLLDALRAALAELRGAAPVALVLEDLHAAHPASLELLQLLVQELRALPLLVVVTYRPLSAKRRPEVDRLLAALAKEGRQLPLRGLSVVEVHHLIERARGGATAHEVARRVHEATAGNPGLVLEVARGLDDPTVPRIGDVPLADGVRAAVHRRLHELDEEGAAILAPAAVLAPHIDWGRLRRLAGLAREDLLRAVGACVRSGVLVEDRDHPGRYRFRVDLLRHVVLADLPPAERASLHQHAAAAIEDLHARDPEPHLDELARHYLAAPPEDVDRALAVVVGAARRAEELLRLDRAVELWAGALELAEANSTDRLQRCDLLQVLGQAQRRSGEHLAARETLLEAAREARSAGDGHRLARAALACAGKAVVPTAGAVDRGLVELLTEAAQRCDDDAMRAALLGRLALERYHVDPPEVRERRTREAVDLAHGSGDRAALAAALHARHFMLGQPDEVHERLRNAAEVLRLAEEEGEEDLALQAHSWCVVAHLELGDSAGADRHIAAHSRLADATANPYHRWTALVFRAMRALMEGRFPAAERHAESAYELGARQEVGAGAGHLEPDARMLHTIQLFEARREQGRLSELEATVSLYSRSFPHQPVWRAALAFLRMQQGRTAEAGDMLEHIATGGLANLPIDRSWFVTTTLLAELVAGLGDARRARELHRLLLPYEQRVVVVLQGAACRGSVAYYLGLLRAASGDHAQAVAHLRVALEIDERLGARPRAARTRVALAASLRALGGAPDEVADLLRTARTAAVDLGLDDVAARAQLALVDAGPLPAAPVPGTDTAPAPSARLVREGSRWTVTFEGRISHVRDAKGMRYLAVLLTEPGVDHPAHLLERLGAGDEAAQGAPRARFAHLQEVLAAAQEDGDAAEVVRVREAMARLAEELSGELDDRRAEQARVNVTRTLRTALRRIGRADPALGEHLDASVRTGASCTYRPDPRAPITWEVRSGEERGP